MVFFSKDSGRVDWWLVAGIVALAVWILCCAFPLLCYEGDSLHLAAGCELMSHHGWHLRPSLEYAYHMQPAAPHLIVAVHYLLPWLDCEQVYCLLTGLASVVFAMLSLVLVARLLPQLNRWYIMLALVLLPETFAIAGYPNTAVLAGVVWLAAMLALMGRRYVVATVLMGLAPALRIDILMVYPVILPLLVTQGKSVKRATWLCVKIAIGVLALTAACYALLGANPFELLSDYEKWNGITEGFFVFVSVLTFYTPLYFVVIPLALVLMVRRRQWALTAVILVPMLIFHILLFRSGNCPKRYLYLIPMAVTAGAYVVDWLRGHRVLRWAFAVVAVALLFVSVRVPYPGKPWLDAPASKVQQGPLVSLYDGGRMRLGLGAGLEFITADERMLFSGNAFYPEHIRRVKRQYVDELRSIGSVLDTVSTDYNLVILMWTDKIQYPNQLLKRGATIERVSDKDYTVVDYRRPDGVTVTVYRRETDGGDAGMRFVSSLLDNEFRDPSRPTYFATTTEAHAAVLDSLTAAGRLVRPRPCVYRVP